MKQKVIKNIRFNIKLKIVFYIFKINYKQFSEHRLFVLYLLVIFKHHNFILKYISNKNFSFNLYYLFYNSF